MSDLFVDNIKHQSSQGSGTITIGASGEKVNLGADAGGTFTNRPAFEAYVASNTNISDNTETTAAFDTEVFDTDNCYDNATNYRFTPTVAGKFFCYSQIRFNSATSNNIQSCYLVFRKNGSYVHGGAVPFFQPNASASATNILLHISSTISLNGSTDYVDVAARLNVGTGNATIIQEASLFGAYRLIGV